MNCLKRALKSLPVLVFLLGVCFADSKNLSIPLGLMAIGLLLGAIELAVLKPKSTVETREVEPLSDWEQTYLITLKTRTVRDDAIYR